MKFLRISSFTGVALLLLGSCHVVMAQLPPTPPIDLPPERPARPQMPTHFDRATVEQMLADIDKPYNAAQLKIGYFLRGGQPDLPTKTGFELLSAAAQAEPVGTRKWFLLQNLRAFAAFRVAGVNTSEGFGAYNALFAHTDAVTPAHSVYILRQAITDFVTAVGGKFSDLDLVQDGDTQQTLLKAWEAYAVVLADPQNAAYASMSEPDWKKAIDDSGMYEAFKPAIEKVIADDKVPKTFSILMAASFVLSQDPNREVEFLQRAKAVLPRLNGQLDVNQAVRFYNALSEQLSNIDRLPEAITTQQELVNLTGRGYDKLLLFQFNSGNKAEVEKILAILSEPTANEEEINKAASTFFILAHEAERANDPLSNPLHVGQPEDAEHNVLMPGRIGPDFAAPDGADDKPATKTPEAQAGEQAATLLKTYLTAPRARDLEQELTARSALADFYVRHKQLDDAKAVLTITPPQEPLPPRVRTLLRDIKRMRDAIEKRA